MTSGDKYEPIDCNAFDYVELACLYRYPVRLYLRDGRVKVELGLDRSLPLLEAANALDEPLPAAEASVAHSTRVMEAPSE